MKKILIPAAVQLSLAMSVAAYAESPDGIWQDLVSKSMAEKAFSYRGIATDLETLETYLADAPLEGAAEGLRFYYPRPDGGYLRLEAFYSPIMAPELEARYPEIRTYKVFGVEEEGISGRIDTTPRGFHGYVNTPDATMIIEPEASFGSPGSVALYRGFFKEEAPAGEPVACETHEHDHSGDSEYGYLKSLALPEMAAMVSSGDNYRVYRMAMAATAEFTASVSTNPGSPSVAEAQAFIVSVVNRVNQIFEKEVAARFQLVGDNDDIVYADPDTDPYSSSNNLLSENQANTDSVIGSANYDIGHLLNQFGGGLAYLGVVCDSTYKARGRTGAGNPDNHFEYFVTDLLAHELGHQFGAGHTFNAVSGYCGGNRSASSAWEVGAGSTIMSYAGLCDSQDLQNNADDFFHGGSLEQMRNHMTGSGGSCGTLVNTGNTPPTVDAGADYTIPARTPFMLTASANDVDTADQAGLTYIWEQMDVGGSTANTSQMATDDGQRPLFRSFQSTSSPTRYFPQLSAIISGDLSSSFGEALPTTDRELNFRVTVRSGDFGVNQDDVVLTVDKDSGPFAVTAPGSGNYSGGQELDVVWNVADTDLAPVSCTEVDIHLSRDGGTSFTTVVETGVPNDGLERVVMPNVDTLDGRIRVKCSDNLFFNISPDDFTLVSVNTSGNLSVTAVEADKAEGDDGQTTFTFQVTRQFAIIDMTVDFNVTGTGADPAGAEDFGGELPSGTVSLAAGEASRTFTVNVSGDGNFEEDESFQVTISNPSSGLVAQSSAGGTIQNDDQDVSRTNGSSSSSDGDSGGGGAAWWLLVAVGLLRLGYRR